MLWELFIVLILFLLLFIIRVYSFPIIKGDYFGINYPPEFETNYKNGYHHMKESKVVFAGLLRDREKQIPFIKNYFSKITPYFQDYRILIVENDSKDKTRELLIRWSQEDPKVIILGCGENVLQCHLSLPATYKHKVTIPRIQKMVKLRNIYIDYIKSKLSNFDYLLVYDMDIKGSAYIEGLSDTFYYLQHYPSVDCVSCNPKFNWVRNWQYNPFDPNFIYYDPFALRFKNPEEIFGEEAKDPKVWGELVNGKLNISHKLEGLIPVISAFAGLSICRISSILKNNSYYSTSETEEVCEHTPFFESMDNVYINPKLVYYIKDF